MSRSHAVCQPRRLIRDVVILTTIFVTWTTSGAGLAAEGTAAPKAPGSAAPAADTPSIMDSIFTPLSVVLPLSFDMNAFSAEKNRKKVEENLKLLVGNVSALEKHASGRDRSFEYVAKSLFRDVRNLQRWYGRGYYDEARFTLHNMTENCITCHSSLPEGKKFPPADKFFAAIKLADLPPLERAHMLVLSRQFDAALSTYEELFKAREIHPMNIVVLGAFTDYLKVCIHVKSDLKRPQATLQEIIARPVTPMHVREQVSRWLGVLKEFESGAVLASSDLATGRRIMEEGRKLQEFPRDRDGLMHYLIASAVLNRFVNSHSDRGPDVAEAYYLLGIAESLLSHSFWISRTEFFFESAIRLAPAADFAPKAYAQLEESLVAGYTGSSGTHLPDDVKNLLVELRQIIEQSKGAKK